MRDRFFGNLHTHGTYIPSYFSTVKKNYILKLYVIRGVYIIIRVYCEYFVLTYSYRPYLVLIFNKKNIYSYDITKYIRNLFYFYWSIFIYTVVSYFGMCAYLIFFYLQKMLYESYIGKLNYILDKYIYA